MISGIKIKNFKSIKDFDYLPNQILEFSNLNLLTGLNGLGKSSLLQTFLLLRQSFESLQKKNKELLINDYLIKLGGFKDIFNDAADITEHIEINIFFDMTNEVYWKFSTSTEENKLSVLETNFKKQYHKNALFQINKFQYLEADRITHKDNLVKFLNNFSVENHQLDPKGILSGAFLIVHGNKDIPLKNLCHSSEVGKKNTNYALAHQVERWLSEISPNIKIYFTEKTDEVDVRFGFANGNDTVKDYSRVNVGFGITYALPIIIALLSAKAGDLIIIENPESHLHPKGQSKLAELMCLAAQNGVQIFCETHSDHIVNGVRVGIIKNKKENVSEKVKIFYFTKDSDNSTSKVFDIPITQDAKLKVKELRKNDITGFFDQIDTDLSIILNYENTDSIQ